MRARSSCRCCRRTSTSTPARAASATCCWSPRSAARTTASGSIANRIRRNTLTYQSLIRFLHTLGIPIVATMRDSQNYVRAAELGIGVHEMKSYVAREDIEQWRPLVQVAGRRPRPAAPEAAAAGSPRARHRRQCLDHAPCRCEANAARRARGAGGGTIAERLGGAARAPRAGSRFGGLRASRRPRTRASGRPSSCSSTRCRDCA